MSVKVSSWVWHSEECAELAGNEMILLLALADVADDNGRCRFLAEDDDLSYAGLAKKVRVDKRTIERLIPKLRNRGLLAQVKGTKTRPNEFRVLVPWASESADNVSGNASGIPRQRGNIPRQREQDSPTNDASTHLYIRKDVRDVDGSARKRASRIPDPFILTSAMREWAAEEVPGLDLDAHTREFVDYWRAASGQNASKFDWVATWRNWMRKAHRWNPGSRDTFARQKQNNMLSIVESYRQKEQSDEEVRSGAAPRLQALDRGY